MRPASASNIGSISTKQYLKGAPVGGLFANAAQQVRQLPGCAADIARRATHVMRNLYLTARVIVARFKLEA
jgi:hypothetical protein